MSSLPIRIVSALVLLFIVLGTFYWYSDAGLQYLGLIFCVIGAWEFSAIGLNRFAIPKIVRFWFLFICAGIIYFSVSEKLNLANVLALYFVVYLSVAIWMLKNVSENEKILNIFSFSALGFVYCGVLPTFALRLFSLQDGRFWFLYLLVIVFAGDIAAFFGGILLGKKKLLPNISPSKTRVGAVSGLIGSVAAGCVVWHYCLDYIPLQYVVVFSIIGGILAQNGDLFESLIKRVAGVKDSGRIMPGHGGLLDRLDGIYFAAPLVFFFAQLFARQNS